MAHSLITQFIGCFSVNSLLDPPSWISLSVSRWHLQSWLASWFSVFFVESTTFCLFLMALFCINPWLKPVGWGWWFQSPCCSPDLCSVIRVSISLLDILTCMPTGIWNSAYLEHHLHYPRYCSSCVIYNWDQPPWIKSESGLSPPQTHTHTYLINSY